MTTSEFPKTLADNRYLLVKPLGEGGMATVFRAYDVRLGVWRAIKLLSPALAKKPKLRQRFEAEAQTMAMLEHKHIVRVYDVGNDNGVAYIVMELLTGGCLVDWLEDHGPMPPRLALNVMIEVCEGIAVAHQRGVIHRDIKPHNVLITADGICRVADFGIARVDDGNNNMTKTGAVMGTWGYMAPEQRSNAKGVDGRADEYALAATLYSLLTNKTPMDLFAADRDADMMEGIPAALVDVLIKATEYRREDRFPDVPTFAAALRELIPQMPEDPPETPPISRPAGPPMPAPNVEEFLRGAPETSYDPRTMADPGAEAAQSAPRAPTAPYGGNPGGTSGAFPSQFGSGTATPYGAQPTMGAAGTMAPDMGYPPGTPGAGQPGMVQPGMTPGMMPGTMTPGMMPGTMTPGMMPGTLAPGQGAPTMMQQGTLHGMGGQTMLNGPGMTGQYPQGWPQTPVQTAPPTSSRAGLVAVVGGMPFLGVAVLIAIIVVLVARPGTTVVEAPPTPPVDVAKVEVPPVTPPPADTTAPPPVDTTTPPVGSPPADVAPTETKTKTKVKTPTETKATTEVKAPVEAVKVVVPATTSQCVNVTPPKTVGLNVEVQFQAKLCEHDPALPVRLYYRPVGTSAWKSKDMALQLGAHRAKVLTDGSYSGGIEYYVVAGSVGYGSADAPKRVQ